MARRVCWALCITIGLGLCLGPLGGCSRRIRFAVRGIVKDAANGSSLRGVSISLKADATSGPIPHMYKGPHPTPALPMRTDERGLFEVSLQDVDQVVISLRPRWNLVLTKEGYETVRVDISPDPTNLPAKRAVIRVIVEMRKEPNAEALRERGRERLKVGSWIESRTEPIGE